MIIGPIEKIKCETTHSGRLCGDYCRKMSLYVQFLLVSRPRCSGFFFNCQARPSATMIAHTEIKM